jgi:hypothetical protein
MSQRWIWALLALMVAAVTQPALAQQGKGVKNGTGKEWSVRYHLNDPNKWGDIALRLFIDRGTGNSKSLQGKLYRYDDKTDDGKYKPRTDGGAVVTNLSGSILANQEEGNRRKRETFRLDGSYLHTDGTTHDVMVLGFHYAGKNKAVTDRTDDTLVIRMVDKVHSNVAPAGAPGDPCDEQPPDEDVLTEDAPADPPAYDPETNP